MEVLTSFMDTYSTDDVIICDITFFWKLQVSPKSATNWTPHAIIYKVPHTLLCTRRKQGCAAISRKIKRNRIRQCSLFRGQNLAARFIQPPRCTDTIINPADRHSISPISSCQYSRVRFLAQIEAEGALDRVVHLGENFSQTLTVPKTFRPAD